MRKLLVPIDPDNASRTRSAVAEVVRIAREEGAEVHLLRVLPRLSSHVALCFQPGELQKLQHGMGEEDLAQARGLLDAAGVPSTGHVAFGRSAQTIAATAQALRCDRVVMGEEGPGLAGKLFGSLAQQVRHLLGAGDCQVIGS